MSNIEIENGLSIGGEFRAVVKRADGSVRQELPWQKNLVTDNGLRLILGIGLISNEGTQAEFSTTAELMGLCAVGDGSLPPVPGDIKLSNFASIEYASPEFNAAGKDLPNTKHPNHINLWGQKTFVFTGEKVYNKNLSEIGLCSWKESDGKYYLVTHAQLKDSSGSPITLTLLEGEILEIVYRINLYVDVRRKTGSFKLKTISNGVTTEDIYDYFAQPYSFGTGNYSIYYHGFGRNNYTVWGVKETAPDPSYNLDDPVWKSLDYTLNHDTFADKISGSVYTSDASSNVASESYRKIVVKEKSWENKRAVYEITHGIYGLNVERGIRVYSSVISNQNYWGFYSTLVVVKNRTTGLGIPKTNRQQWTESWVLTVNRWEG